jgi:hypothetical protein
MMAGSPLKKPETTSGTLGTKSKDEIENPEVGSG